MQILGTFDDERVTGRDACQHGDISSAVHAQLDGAALDLSFPEQVDE